MSSGWLCSDAFDNFLAAGILRLQGGLDYSDYVEEDGDIAEGKQETSANFESESGCIVGEDGGRFSSHRLVCPIRREGRVGDVVDVLGRGRGPTRQGDEERPSGWAHLSRHPVSRDRRHRPAGQHRGGPHAVPSASEEGSADRRVVVVRRRGAHHPHPVHPNSEEAVRLGFPSGLFPCFFEGRTRIRAEKVFISLFPSRLRSFIEFKLRMSVSAWRRC